MELSKLLTERGYEDVVFLADCAMISTESPSKLAKQRVQFISRLPETFNLAAELKELAWSSNEWENLGQLASAPTDKSAVYHVWKTNREIEGEQFGFVVVHSSNLEERKEKKLSNEVEGIKKALCRRSTELKKQTFACEADASRGGDKLREYVEKTGFDCEVLLLKREEVIHGKKGRPKRGSVPEIRVSWYAEVRVGNMKEADLERKKRLASTFVLVYRLVGGQKVERPTAKTISGYLAEMSVVLIAGQLMLPNNIPENAEK